MKKEFVFAISLVLLISLAAVACADDIIPDGSAPAAPATDAAATDAGTTLTANPTDSAKSAVSSAAGEIGGKLNSDVNIPENAQFIFRLLFGMKAGEKVVLNALIIMFAFLIVFFLVIMNIISMLPFFEGWKKWVGTVIATLLLGISGGINQIAIFFAGLGSGIDFLNKYPILRLLTALFILGIILLSTSKVTNLIKNKMELEQARQTGAEIKKGSKSANILSQGVEVIAGARTEIKTE